MKIFISENIKKENPLKNFIFQDFLEWYEMNALSEYQINYAKEYVLNNKKELYPFFKNLLVILDELKKYNLPFSDISNPKNWGIKNKHYALFDIGYGDRTRFDVDVDEIIDEDQSDYITRDGEKIYKKTPKDLREKILKHFNVENATYLNSGYFGDVFDIGNNKLLKITNDANEAKNAKKIIGKNLEYVANIYNAYKILWDNLPYYILFIEKIKTDGVAKYVNEYWIELRTVFDIIAHKDIQLDYNEVFNLIKNKSLAAAKFYMNLYFYGHKAAYSNWNVDEKGSEIDGIDLNDLYDISKWTLGSVTNDYHYKQEVPDYIKDIIDNFK